MRRERRGRRVNWLAPIIIASLMGAVAYTVTFKAPEPMSIQNAGNEPAILSGSVSSVRFEVGIKTPRSDRDQLYRLDTTGRTVERVETDANWRVESLSIPLGSLRLIPSEERGFKLTDGAEWNVALRAATGEAYLEPRVLGMFDDRHAAVLARTERIRILNVSRAGQVTAIADVPENANVLGLSGGAVWYATFTPGEGIESEPTGPSELVRINADGTRTSVAKTSSVITSVIADRDGIAWGTEAGTLEARFVTSETNRQIEGTPLGFVRGRVVFGRGTRLLFLNADGSNEEIPISLPAAASIARQID